MIYFKVAVIFLLCVNMGRKLFYTKLLLRLFFLNLIVGVHGDKREIYPEERQCNYPFCPECSRSGCYWTVFDNQSKFCEKKLRLK